MRTQDRTYLASLGFADLDKRNDLHDLACLYMAQPEKAAKLLCMLEEKDGSTVLGMTRMAINAVRWKYDGGLIESENKIDFNSKYFQLRTLPEKIDFKYSVRKISLSAPITLDATRIVGYIDILLEIKIDKFVEYYTAEKREESLPNYIEDISGQEFYEKWNNLCSYSILIEVKANTVSTANIIQQINTYKNFTQNTIYVVATLFPVTEMEKYQLKGAGIHHIFISTESLKEFAQRQSLAEEESF